ncbi:hypothetical protein ACLB2K_060799 [Fragaria x ananassa]
MTCVKRMSYEEIMVSGSSWPFWDFGLNRKVVGVENLIFRNSFPSVSLSSSPRRTQPFFAGEEVGRPATVLAATGPVSSVSSTPIQQCRSLMLATGVQGEERPESHYRSDLSLDPNPVTSDNVASLVRVVSSMQSFLGKWMASP